MFARFGRTGPLAALAVALVLPMTAAPAAAFAPATVSATPAPGVGFNDEVLTLASTNATVYVGGLFTVATDGGRRTERSYLAAVDGRTGRLLDRTPEVDGPVTALAAGGGYLYLAGRFAHVDGQPRRHLARVRLADGSLDTGFRHSISAPPARLALGNGRLYVVGNFGSVDGRSWPHAAAFDTADGALDTGFRPATDGTVDAVAAGGGRVYLGGMFLTVNGSTAHHRFAAVDTDGATVESFAGAAPAIVHDIEIGPDGVYAAVGGAGGRITSYDGAGRAMWSLTTDGDMRDVVLLGDAVYGGGHFDHACSTTRVAALHGTCLDGSVPRGKLVAADTGGHLLGWAPQANSTRGVTALAAVPTAGALAAGGSFTRFGTGTAQSRFALFRS